MDNGSFSPPGGYPGAYKVIFSETLKNDTAIWVDYTLFVPESAAYKFIFTFPDFDLNVKIACSHALKKINERIDSMNET